MSFVLNLRVVEAKDIDKMDTIGKTDAYCEITFSGSQMKKTEVKKNTLTPVWNETFSFPVLDMNGKLDILMKDKDVLKDDKMANLQISLNALKLGDVVDQWFPMTPIKAKKGGELHLILHLADKDDQPFVPKPHGPPPPHGPHGPHGPRPF